MILTRMGEIIHEWVGWCPNAPAMHTAQAMLTVPEIAMLPGEPAGGAGGSGRIDRGFAFAVESTKTLFRNKRHLWFSLLTGLTLVFMFVAAYVLHVFQIYPYPAMDPAQELVLMFCIELVTVFFLYCIVAGLIAGIFGNTSGRHAGFGEDGKVREGLPGLSVAGIPVRSLFSWSVIMAVCATAIYAVFMRNSENISTMMHLAVFRFPFYMLQPESWGPGPIAGGYHVTFAILFTLSLTIINVVLFILTLYVVPILVHERTTLRKAVAGSVSLMKKTWVEVFVCFFIFGLVFAGFSLTSLLFRVGHDIVSYDNLFFWYQGGWIVSAALYAFAWCVFAILVSTVAGIAIVKLYTYGKTGAVSRARVKPREE